MIYISFSKEKTLFVDYDGVIVNTIKAIVDLYNKEFNSYALYEYVKWQKINTWMFNELILTTREHINEYFASQEFFDIVEFMPFANEALHGLYYKKKYKIIVVSCGDNNNLRLKEKWLKNNLPFVEFIGVNLDVYKNKSHIDMSGEYNFFIDDSENNLITSNAFNKICFGDKYQWNENWDGTRIQTWMEMYSCL